MSSTGQRLRNLRRRGKKQREKLKGETDGTCSIKDTTKIETNFYLNKIWIQCENNTCLKWRLLTKQDARQFDLNQPWYCHLSSDPCFNNCSVPEDHFPAESQFYRNGLKFIYSQLAMGSLVMVKLNRWPSWPAILCPNPESGEEKTHVNYYHVEFLGKPHTRGFVSVDSINTYYSSFKPKDQIQTKWYKSALEEAKQIYAFTCEQRIEMCHVTKRCIQKLQRLKRKPRKSITKVNKRKKKYNSSDITKDGALSQENSVMSEAEGILQTLEKILVQVTEPFCKTQIPHDKQVNVTDEKLNQSKHTYEDYTDEDCIIIDGIEFKIGDCIESITNNFKEIDTLMSEFPKTF